MWFIGLFAGFLLGSMLVGGYGTLWGGLLGAAAGVLISYFRGQSSQPEFEARLAALEAAVRELRQKMSQSPGTAAPSAAVRPEPVTAAPVAVATPEIPQAEDISPVPTPPVAVEAAAESSTPEPAYAEPVSPQLAEPSFFGRAWNWLTGGNALVRVGVVVLFFGVAFLLKYAYEHTHVPIEVRLIGVALGAVVLLVLGWRLRESRPGYALSLQGAGVGVLYLTIFAAFRLYALLSPLPAFVLLVAVAVFSTTLAVLQNSLALAVIAASGGFLAPVLASTGRGSHVVLFSYYLVLNLGIFAIAWRKAWRVLNLVGFGFTFVIGTLWGVTSYRPEL